MTNRSSRGEPSRRADVPGANHWRDRDDRGCHRGGERSGGLCAPRPHPPERGGRPQGDRQAGSDTQCRPTGCPPQGWVAMRCKGGGDVGIWGEGAARAIRGSLAGSTRIEEDARRQAGGSHGAASPPLAQGRGCTGPPPARPLDPLSRRLCQGGARLLRGGAPQRCGAGKIAPCHSTRARSGQLGQPAPSPR